MIQIQELKIKSYIQTTFFTKGQFQTLVFGSFVFKEMQKKSYIFSSGSQISSSESSNGNVQPDIQILKVL